jgi:hypothetical protein
MVVISVVNWRCEMYILYITTVCEAPGFRAACLRAPSDFIKEDSSWRMFNWRV